MMNVVQLLKDEEETLGVAGFLDQKPDSFVLVVGKDHPLLLNILQKAIDSITVGDMSAVYQGWRDDTLQSKPKSRDIWFSYHLQIITALLLFASMLVSLFLSIRAYRAKRQSDASKSKFLAMMSHELRTPLGVVLAATELLQSTTLTPHQQQLIQQAELEAQSLLSLLNDVLDISRMDAGKLELEIRNTDLTCLLQQLMEQYQAQTQAKNVSLTLQIADLPDDLLMLDGIRLRQVLHNLLSNAIKFTSQGFIKLSASIRQDDEGQIVLRIMVEDSGIGISSAQQRKLFQPFSQADNSVSRQFGGSGLGLSICKELIGLMQGKIQLQSTPGKGT
ncbi:MAG: sensor histidine kinase, partial [Iodobacter sp.]